MRRCLSNPICQQFWFAKWQIALSHRLSATLSAAVFLWKIISKQIQNNENAQRISQYLMIVATAMLMIKGWVRGRCQWRYVLAEQWCGLSHYDIGRLEQHLGVSEIAKIHRSFLLVLFTLLYSSFDIHFVSWSFFHFLRLLLDNSMKRKDHRISQTNPSRSPQFSSVFPHSFSLWLLSISLSISFPFRHCRRHM